MSDLNVDDIKKQLSIRKVLIPVVIGLLAAGYMLYSSLTAVRYEPIPSGDYIWVDSNDDGKIDPANDEEFILSESGAGNYERVTYRDTLRKIDWSGTALFFFALAIACLIIRVGGYIFRLRVLSDKQFTWRQCFDVVMLWEFASALTPSVVGGSAVAIFFLNREGMNLGKSTAIVMVTAMMDEIFYVSMVPLILIFVGMAGLFPADWEQSLFGFTLTAEGLFWVGYLFTFVLLMILVYAIFINPRAFRYVLLKLFSLPFLRKWRYRIVAWGDDLMTTSRELKNQKSGYWFKGLAATFASWSARFLLLNCLLMMVVPGIDNLLAYAKQIVMWMIMLISPTPGSSGVAEFAFYEFFGGSVVPVTVVGLLAILWRLMTYFPYLFAGVLILPSWIRRTAHHDNR
ncbi:MAG: flippase-like domain-containing protein [Flavobacteriales bacterium]|nr:flippase-like domain-containing protein [Flavobacteriales bacterium]